METEDGQRVIITSDGTPIENLTLPGMAVLESLVTRGRIDGKLVEAGFTKEQISAMTPEQKEAALLEGGLSAEEIKALKVDLTRLWSIAQASRPSHGIHRHVYRR